MISDSDDEPGEEAGEAEQGNSRDEEEEEEEEGEEEEERGQSAGQCQDGMDKTVQIPHYTETHSHF